MDKIVRVDKKREGGKVIYRFEYESGPSVVVEAVGDFDKGFRVLSISYTQGGIGGVIEARNKEELNTISALVFLINDLAVSMGQGNTIPQ
ncbi:hypothetical protein [Saccharolobus caldissimus]|uniref:Uncharacterized protein n=1 Tax=Saccharolobus caldissimus TaxID=1702097 RepID=A0AAQ4CNR6_9CREN|nr:hypothetical protein [Saccharolobus caldissimus]BDB97447.1 hypothetical protein SACC_04640 [Saccharolobus caldissimus]